MTRTYKPTGSELVEQPTVPGYLKADESLYQDYLSSLTRYTINPSDWTGIQEVKEGEFVWRYQVQGMNKWLDCNQALYNENDPSTRRLFAIPKRKEQGQEEAAEDLLREYMTITGKPIDLSGGIGNILDRSGYSDWHKKVEAFLKRTI